MKKWMLTVVAAGALAVGGAASAQDVFGLGNVLPQILGNLGLGGIVQPGPAAQAGTVYESGGQYIYVEQGTGRQYVLDRHRTYVDGYGQRVQVDGMGGTTVLGQNGVTVTPYGSLPQTIQNGTTVPIGSAPAPQSAQVPQTAQVSPYPYSYGGVYTQPSSVDRDGDGVPDAYDRYPYDPRFR